MDATQYQIEALRTEHTPAFVRLEGETDEHNMMLSRMLHAVLGMASEVGEIADALKKHIIYRRALDMTNMIEEPGDLMWYEVLFLDAARRTIPEAMERNIAKLRARFGDKFSEAAAVSRDLRAERAALEGPGSDIWAAGAQAAKTASRDHYKHAFFDTLYAWLHRSDQDNRDWLIRSIETISDSVNRGMSLSDTRARLEEAARAAGRT